MMSPCNPKRLRPDGNAIFTSGKAEGGAIVLARLEDDRVRDFLARNGLKADSAVGPEGYLLFSDKSHLIVAANTGQCRDDDETRQHRVAKRRQDDMRKALQPITAK